MGDGLDEVDLSRRCACKADDVHALPSGRHIKFANVRCDPTRSGATIPLHILGVKKMEPLQSITFCGDGYFPWVGAGLDLHETLSHVINAVRDEAALLGRDPRTIEMTAGGARTVGDAERLAEQEVSDHLCCKCRRTRAEEDATGRGRVARVRR